MPIAQGWRTRRRGRSVPNPNPLSGFEEVLKVSGKPDWNVEMPLIPQPEITLSTTPLTLDAKCCPLPTGKS
jgi:hypothetical protein